jgi:hypothetical protein
MNITNQQGQHKIWIFLTYSLIMGCLQGLHLITLVTEWPLQNTHHLTPILSRTEQYGQQWQAEASIHCGIGITIISVVY